MINKLSLNKNQQIAAEYKDQHILVLAGAGTGKTLTIIARAEYLIRKGVDPRRILLLTFTRRAARGDLKRRISIYSERKYTSKDSFRQF